MSKRLNILHLEDEPDFAELVRTLFAQDGLEADTKRAGNREEFEKALEAGGYDLIISDYHLPKFTGVEAMAIVKKKFPNLPFILVSGTIGEQAAIESLKAGATDYILKQNPERLSSAVRRAVKEAGERSRLRVAEEELRDSEKQYRLLFHGNPNPMWVFDLETQEFLEVNEAAIQQYGYSREEFLRMTIAEIRPPDKNGKTKLVMPDTSERSVVWRHRRKNGADLEVEVIWSPMVFRGRFAALTMAVDVTERRRVEHRNSVFSKLSHRLSMTTTATEAAAIICDAADGLFHWTDFALDLYDAESDTVESLLNITTVEGRRVELPPSPQPKVTRALVRRVIEKGPELVGTEESTEYPAATMLTPIRKGEKVIGLLLIQNHRPGTYSAADLAMLQTLAEQCSGALERVRGRAQLRESEQRFRDLFENSPDAIFVEDVDGTVLDVNLAACVLHGYTREQLIGKNALSDLVAPAHRKEARELFPKLVSGKLTWAEGQSLTVDGRAVPTEVRVSRIEYGGKPALLLHVRDTTDRQAAAVALQSSEALFRSVWENSVDGMRLTDENGVVVAVNDAYCRLMEMPAGAMEGKLFTTAYNEPDNAEALLRSHQQYFVVRGSSQKRQVQHTLHNGRQLMLEITDSFIEVQGRPLLMLSLLRDVTAQRRLEEQLRQSQKMEAIGQLAGGVAHDFNNILTVIHGHASLLGMTDLDDTGARSANQIVQAAERAAGLTRQLLTFSRRQLIQPKRLDMNKIVGNMTDMLGRILGEDVALQLNYSQSPAMVEADAGMMEQVLLNLAVNARDAMPRGGQLSVRIAVMEVNEGHVQNHPEARTGRFVSVSNTDTGCGIADENISRIFEPFFTTKEIGKGTGLGLATVYGIVKQHQGWVEVESAVGKGTTFRIFIPSVGEAPAELERPTTQITVRGGVETILLVEDEKPVRELVARVLEKQGYTVLQAGTGAEAVGIWHERGDNIALLLTDLVMPQNMNGRELAETLWAEKPDLKVIFTSGYSADIVGRDFKLESNLNFLQKPYHPQTLALVVRRCLDGKHL